MKETEKKGIIFVVIGAILWGILPIYWRQLKGIPAFELLNYRIILSFLSLGIYIIVSGKFKEYIAVLKDKKTMKKILLSAMALFVNWGTYTYTMVSDKIMEASLAYYISPLLMALIGLLIFKEKINKSQKYGMALALVGVAVLTVGRGVIPLWGVFIAISFATYGGIKKTINLNPFISLALEMTVALPFAIGFLFLGKGPSPVVEGQMIYLFLLGGITVIPLLFFVKGTQVAKLSDIAILQYISPTLSLMIGVFLYGEVFTTIHLISFIIIWGAVVMFIIPFLKKKKEYKLENR